MLSQLEVPNLARYCEDGEDQTILNKILGPYLSCQILSIILVPQRLLSS